MAPTVLDSSALLAYLLAEPGAKTVMPYLGNAFMSAVNLSEVVARLAARGAPKQLIESQLGKLRISLCDFDEDLAYATALLREKTKEFGLSLGDRACIATAARLGLAAVTADREWAKAALDIEIILIRPE